MYMVYIIPNTYYSIHNFTIHGYLLEHMVISNIHRLRDTTTLNVTGVTFVFRVLRLFRLWRASVSVDATR